MYLFPLSTFNASQKSKGGYVIVLVEFNVYLVPEQWTVGYFQSIVDIIPNWFDWKVQDVSSSVDLFVSSNKPQANLIAPSVML